MMFLLPLLLVAALLQALPQPAPWSDLETAKLAALAQEGRAIEAEQRALALDRERWQGKIAAFKAAAEAARPGFTWNADTGAWTPKSPEKPKEP